MTKIVNLLLAIIVVILLAKLIAKDGPEISHFATQIAALIDTQNRPKHHVKVATPAPFIPVVRRPAILEKMVTAYGEENGSAEYTKFLDSAPQFQLHGTVQRHLADGHILTTAVVVDMKSHIGNREALLLFGLPEAEALADGEIYDCYAAMAEPVKMEGGSMVREFIYTEPNGRPIFHFERSTYP